MKRKKLGVGDPVWHYATCNWTRGTVLAIGRFRALIRDDSYTQLEVLHWRWIRRLRPVSIAVEAQQWLERHRS